MRTLGVLLMWIALAGCGGHPPLCETVTRLETAVKAKTGDCQITINDWPVSSMCMGAVSACTEADRQQIENAAKCVEVSSTCMKGDELGWAFSIAFCSANKLSAPCTAVLVPPKDGG